MRSRALLIALFCLGAFGLAGCAEDTGAESPQAAVDAYIAALNAKDAAAVQRLANPSPAARDDDGEHKVRELGGLGITLDATDITTPVSPDHAVARLRGKSSVGDYSEELKLQRDPDDDRWRIALHRPQPPVPAKPTATITPP